MKRLCFAMTLLLLGQSVSFAFDTELKGLSATLAERIAKSGKKSVAVVDFADLQGNVTDGGRFLAEEFTVNLTTSSKDFKVIERTRLKTILEEHKLASTGIIDPQTAKKLGQIAGVDTIVTGIVTPLGESVRLAVKVLAVDTAEIIAATSGDLPITKPLQTLFAKPQPPTHVVVQTPSEATPSMPATGQQVKEDPIRRNLMLATAANTSYIGTFTCDDSVLGSTPHVERLRFVFTEQKDFVMSAKASNPDNPKEQRAFAGELCFNAQPEKPGSVAYTIVMSPVGGGSYATRGLYGLGMWSNNLRLRLTDKGLEGEADSSGKSTIRLVRE